MNIENVLYVIVPSFIVVLVAFALIQLRRHSKSERFIRNAHKEKVNSLMKVIELYHMGVLEMQKKGLHPGCSCSKDECSPGFCMNCCFIDAESKIIDDSVGK